MLNESVLNKIVRQLQPADPYKIILFGSNAKGTASKDSDIDLMVILDNDFVSKSCAERLNRNWEVKKLILDINSQYAMDVIICSRAEYQNKKDEGNFFLQAVEKTGKAIYEKDN
ncbi:MAG: nucleotidyltransferase domain-containing protein [Elusimicrobiota bacterium]|jgi:predicted nucleotidyltransferase|nr:nucleotidyltransferase domain-containing protein [Elusimicrobiota bacterium]